VTTLSLDNLHEECGVFGIVSHPEAARMAYLGYLLACSIAGRNPRAIVSSDRQRLHIEKGMGYVARWCSMNPGWKDSAGDSAIGHVAVLNGGRKRGVERSAILNDCWRGPIALAHNGNLTMPPI
jgi:amidophosphoribosyltransferase